MLGFRASVADELRWLRPKLRWLRPNMHVGPSQADGATPRNRDRSSSRNDKECRGGYMEGAFIRVGRIIGSGWHVYECCRGNATIVHAMDNLWWDGQEDLVGLASINDVKDAVRRAVGSNIVKYDSQVSVRVGQPI